MWGEMERHTDFNQDNDPAVHDWVSRLQSSLIESIEAPIADHQIALAAQAAHLSTQNHSTVGSGRRSALKRRGIVFSGILSTLMAKLMAGVVALAAVTGDAVTAGIDFDDLNPFSGSDDAVTADDPEFGEDDQEAITVESDEESNYQMFDDDTDDDGDTDA